MKTFTQTLFVHEDRLNTGKRVSYPFDMSSQGYVLIGTVEVEVPEFDLPTKEEKMKALCKKLAKSEEDHHKATRDIEDEIKRLEAER